MAGCAACLSMAILRAIAPPLPQDLMVMYPAFSRIFFHTFRDGGLAPLLILTIGAVRAAPDHDRRARHDRSAHPGPLPQAGEGVY